MGVAISDFGVPANPLLQQASSARLSLVGDEQRWPTPCEAQFERMAYDDPSRLIKWIQSGELSEADLSFAAEALGKVALSESVVDSLLALLRHPSAVVREGAIYGLQPHAPYALGARNVLRAIAETDRSKAVQEAAREAIEEDAGRASGAATAAPSQNR